MDFLWQIFCKKIKVPFNENKLEQYCFGRIISFFQRKLANGNSSGSSFAFPGLQDLKERQELHRRYSAILLCEGCVSCVRMSAGTSTCFKGKYRFFRFSENVSHWLHAKGFPSCDRRTKCPFPELRVQRTSTASLSVSLLLFYRKILHNTCLWAFSPFFSIGKS